MRTAVAIDYAVLRVDPHLGGAKNMPARFAALRRRHRAIGACFDQDSLARAAMNFSMRLEFSPVL